MDTHTTKIKKESHFQQISQLSHQLCMTKIQNKCLFVCGLLTENAVLIFRRFRSEYLQKSVVAFQVTASTHEQ